MNMTRLWEKLTGTPHQHNLSGQVKAAAEGLTATVHRFNDKLAPYKEAPDPFIALAVDVYERRQEQNFHRGPE